MCVSVRPPVRHTPHDIAYNSLYTDSGFDAKDLNEIRTRSPQWAPNAGETGVG